MYREIPEEKRKTAMAMLKAGKTVYEVSKALDLSRATVYRIKHEETDEDVEALAGEIRKEMAGRYLILADTILRGIDDSELDKASLKDKAIAAAIFTDKAAQLEKLRDDKGLGKCPLEKGLCPIEKEPCPKERELCSPLETGLRGPGEGEGREKETENAPLAG